MASQPTPQPKTCVDCGKALGRNNTSGYCGAHVGRANLRNPELKARMVRGIQLRLAADPVLREKYRESVRKAHYSPKAIAARKERWARDKPWIAGNAAQPAGSEPRRRAAAKISATRLAWCPAHLRDAYRALTKKGHRAPVARALILEQHETEMRRWRASIGVPDERPEPVIIRPRKGKTFFERASDVAAQWAEVEDIWIRGRSDRLPHARWSVYLALKRKGWTANRISVELGRERKGVGYALDKAEAMAAVPGEFADLMTMVDAA